MKVINPSFEILTPIDGEAILKHIEAAARLCYKSESKDFEATKRFIRNIIRNGHESTIEHYSISVRVICDRGVSHEIVRHRLASYSQESTRYCNYSKDKFGNELTFIRPCFWKNNREKYKTWLALMQSLEDAYIGFINTGATPEEARSILPNSLKTELIITANLREWRHIFRLRTSPQAHPQARELFMPMLQEFKKLIPVIFDDISGK
jgi:thymidylate synthase (FAD)